MRKSATEIIRNLEMRVARLEKQSVRATDGDTYGLALAIEKQIESNGYDLKDLRRNPKILNIDEIEYQDLSLKKEIQKWVRKGFITIEGGEYEESRGGQSYPAGWDAYLITREGVNEVENIILHKSNVRQASEGQLIYLNEYQSDLFDLDY